MTIGKYRFPPYFNTEFLKFNPILFLIKRFRFLEFFIYMPLFGFLAGFFGGLFDWHSDNGIDFFATYTEAITNFLRSRTFIDLWFHDIYGSVYTFFGIKENSGYELLASWIYLAIIWYIKVYICIYIYIKIVYIFFCKPENLTLEMLTKNWFYSIHNEEDNEKRMRKAERKAERSLRMIELFKKL